jgi:Copine
MEQAMAATFQNPIARRGTRVDIRISARGLVGQYDQPPNSMAAVYMRNQKGSAEWEYLTQSEVKHSEACPRFARAFAAEYKFELYQEVRIVVFDCVAEGAPLAKQHLIGLIDTSLASIVSARGTTLELELLNDQKPTSCFVSVSADEVQDAKKDIVLEIALRHLMTPDEQTEQNTYLAQLGAQLQIPSAAPPVQRRPVAAVMSRFRKEEKVPAIRPAHIENIVHAEQQHREQIVQQIQQVHVAPPPFVPFLVISTCPESAVAEFRNWEDPAIPWEECYRSEDVMQYTDMDAGLTLKEIRIPQTVLNGGGSAEEVRYIKFSVMRARAGGATIEVGHKLTTLRALHDTVKPGRDATMNMSPSGEFTIKRYEVIELPSFLDTIKQSQLDMSLVVGIDFTQSNGPPQAVTSLHHQPQPGMVHGPNPYEAAIQSVANLLSAYSSDPRIAAYGFGAKIPPNWEISHCFSLTGDPQMPLCDDVGALLSQYRNVLPRIQLWGPTMFSELLYNFKSIVSQRALAAKGALAYTCALIVTDGVISDMDKTREQLIELSRYPCSVIIIGVGSEDFSKMRTLDDSGEGCQPLKRGRDVAVRRFVQFVDYRSYADDEQGQVDMSRLGEEVLGNIPESVLAYIEYEKSAKVAR